ncbi:4-hydroxy-3-methylbut-2-enyl diphosphate reductase [Oricola cellulosilytica]|uniref:4-hydroxy-3-methylbut-2-enyl diphosphate reductase n=1 Tax=Oricola cellulosilytica TaxID=1429082 RepID=A0A4R0P8S4_9HYPH|nr:4-hydroxy-3-methylbut-2-enyl diphosphate reductase [Oricola cellulosilytica]TCD13472.1 4-hydroxy-3-methylbut-2-enyl diphosphate reductase [Oricola cellulosilytica]
MTVSKPFLTIRLCEPRGFCAGVDRAIQIVVLALKKYGAPVYVRHEIVHNKFVVDGLRERGAVFVRELSDIPPEHKDRPVVFSAHGVAKSVPAAAEARDMFYLDATCPLVSKVHKQAMRHERLGRHVLLIGHADHPEVIGTMGQLPPGAVTLVETVEQVAALAVPDEANLGYVTQTTLSVDDTADIVAALEGRFPALTAPSSESICYATTNRQEAVKMAARGTEMFLIVGAPNSSNSRRLVEVAKRHGAKDAMLVQRASEIDWRRVDGVERVGISAGASAPEIVVEEIIDAFRERFEVKLDIALTVRETENFPVMRDLRDTELTGADMAFLNGGR